MTHYVLGFAFNKDLSQVALIRKKRPKWQKGMLNGIGGHLEDPEVPIEAMVREFREETGIATKEETWREFCLLQGSGFRVNVFSAKLPQGIFNSIRATTDENIEKFWVNHIPNNDKISNLSWLIPMAILRQQLCFICRYQDVSLF